MFEKGFAKKPLAYELQKFFSPNAFVACSSGSRDLTTYQDDVRLFERFYKKYPEAKYMPHGTVSEMKFGGAIQTTHPAAVFIHKQRSLIKKGYTEEKAFQLVEQDFGKFISQQKDEMRILRGVAQINNGNSYMDRFTRVAELESTLKMKRMERDIPKYLRTQNNWMKEIQQLTGQGK